MKITELRFHVARPMGDVPIAEGSVLEWAFVEVVTDEGVVGVGECSNWVRSSTEIIRHAIEAIRSSVVGEDPANIEAIWQKTFRSYTYLGNRGLITTLMSGIDIALWDIKGKVLGRPVYDLLGGAVRAEVPVYVHPGPIELLDDPSLDVGRAIADSAEELVAGGYDSLKFDPFVELWPRHTDYLGGDISRRGRRQATEIVAAVRDTVGPDVELMIDAHGAFNVATAVACMRDLEPFDLTWFEEPLPPEGIDALAQVRSQTTVPICVGERLFTRWDVLPYLQRGLVDYLMPDVCWTGGITELKRISTLAEVFFVPMSPHNALGPLQVVAGAHTMLTVPNFYRLEFHHLWLDWHNRCLDRPLDLRRGALHLSDRPGLGYELNHDFMTDNGRAL